MRPIATEQKGSEVLLVHRCEKCRITRRCKVAENDNFDAILEIMRTASEQQ
jgi:hypothetical protein